MICIALFLLGNKVLGNKGDILKIFDKNIKHDIKNLLTEHPFISEISDLRRKKRERKRKYSQKDRYKGGDDNKPNNYDFEKLIEFFKIKIKLDSSANIKDLKFYKQLYPTKKEYYDECKSEINKISIPLTDNSNYIKSILPNCAREYFDKYSIKCFDFLFSSSQLQTKYYSTKYKKNIQKETLKFMIAYYSFICYE